MLLQSCWQRRRERRKEKERKKRKKKNRGLENKAKGHCGFPWPPLLVNKLGRVKLDNRKMPHKQCDHLQLRKVRGEGVARVNGSFLSMQSPVGVTER